MAGNQLNNLQILEATSPFLTRSIEPTDNIQIGSTVEFQSDVTVQGNLVTQNVVSIQTEELRVQDNHILLNDGYTTAVGQTAGLVANYLPIATTDTVNGAFTAGVAATSNPTVVTTGTATFSVGQFILITGASNEENNGQYEVLSHVGNTLTIRGVGTVSTVEDFSEDQFVTDATVAGSITRINVSVLRSGPDGIWEIGSGSTTPVTFVDITPGAGNDLQAAYVLGNQITTSAAEGDVVIAGTEQLLVTTTGGVDIDTQFDFDGTSFDVQMTGINGFSIDGTAASNVTVNAGDLTLSTTTSGDVIVNSVANVEVDGVSFSVDGTAASNVSVTGANLTLSTLTSGNVLVNSVGDVDMDAVNILADATGSFSIDAATSSNATVSGSSAGALNFTLSAVNAGAGTGNILIAADDEVDVTTVLLDANLTTLEVDASGSFSIDGNAASNLSVTSGNLVLSTITSGSLNLTSAGVSTYTLPNAQTAALTITDSVDTFLVVDSTAGFEAVEVPQFLDILGGGGGVSLTTDDALVAGDLVRVASAASGNVELADANSTFEDSLVVGSSKGTFAATATAQLFTVHGSLVPVRFTAAPAAASNGSAVFLSTTPGQATLTAPLGSGTTIFLLGFLQGADGATTTPEVFWSPQFISRIP